MKKMITMALSMLLVAGLSIGGTLAYLQDTDTKTNTMTMGEVDINILEYQRSVDEDGEWISTGTTDNYGYTPDTLVTYTDDKALYPAVFVDGNIKWDDRNGSTAASGEGSWQQSWAQVKNSETDNVAPGSLQLFDDSVKGVIDKMVFVENTGKSEAYVRVFIAVEQGSVSNVKNVVKFNVDKDHWKEEAVAENVKIDDSTYSINCYTYYGPSAKPCTLAAGAVSYPCLTQVYMMPTATNGDVKNIDGNSNGKYDIKVYAQAVQTENFKGLKSSNYEDAVNALNTAFGESHPWAD